jgi:xylulokinase
MKADICQIQLRLPQISEAACLGAAILAAVGARMDPDIASCVDHAVRFDGIIVPEPERASRYDRRYRLYQKLYPALSPLHREMSSCAD